MEIFSLLRLEKEILMHMGVDSGSWSIRHFMVLWVLLTEKEKKNSRIYLHESL